MPGTKSAARARLEVGRKLGVDRVIEVDREDLAEAVKEEAPEGDRKSV